MRKNSIFVRSILLVLASGVLAACGGDKANQPVAAAASPTYSVSGSVTTAAGTGIAGVTVTAAGMALTTATTAADGRYYLTGMAPGSYTLTPRLAGYTFSPATRTVTVNSADLPTVLFTGTGSGAPITDVAAIAAEGTYTVALKSDSTVWSWGNNSSGQLGDGTTQQRFTPAEVPGLLGVAAIATAGHTLALLPDGTVWSWGLNRYGQLGDGTATDNSTPAAVAAVADVIAIDVSYGSSFLLKKDGTVWSWGLNRSGQLADGTTTDRTTPAVIADLTGVTAISASGSPYFQAIAALKDDGTVWMWGDNTFGQLGDGTTSNRSRPTKVVGLSNVIAVTTKGGHHSVALKADGTVWVWGSASTGALGIGTGRGDQRTPVPVPDLTGVLAIAAGDGVAGGHTVALQYDGTVWTWGDNYAGQLGDGTTHRRYAPVMVAGLSEVTAIAAGRGCSFAITNDGTLWAWGDNLYGQLGDGTTRRSSFPVQVMDR